MQSLSHLPILIKFNTFSQLVLCSRQINLLATSIQYINLHLCPVTATEDTHERIKRGERAMAYM